MKQCTIFHTGVYEFADGVIKNNVVYLQGKDGQLFFPKDMFMAIEECEGGLIQFEVNGKWGFADIHTGAIRIEPVWDYAGPFYNGYAHVAKGAEIEREWNSIYSIQGGRHGYIDHHGKIIIPLEYDDAKDIPHDECFVVGQNKKWGVIDPQTKIRIPLEYDRVSFIYSTKNYKVTKNEKWGIVDQQNRAVIPVEWDVLEENSENNLIFCANEQRVTHHHAVKRINKVASNRILKWGVYDRDGNVIVRANLDEKPVIFITRNMPKPKSISPHGFLDLIFPKKYFILKRNRQYGVLCEDGTLICDATLYKKDAIALIKKVYQKFEEEKK